MENNKIYGIYRPTKTSGDVTISDKEYTGYDIIGLDEKEFTKLKDKHKLNIKPLTVRNIIIGNIVFCGHVDKMDINIEKIKGNIFDYLINKHITKDYLEKDLWYETNNKRRIQGEGERKTLACVPYTFRNEFRLIALPFLGNPKYVLIGTLGHGI